LFVPDSTTKYKPTKGMLLNFDKEKCLSETVVTRRTEQKKKGQKDKQLSTKHYTKTKH
jgi:hypothetical protein